MTGKGDHKRELNLLTLAVSGICPYYFLGRGGPHLWGKGSLPPRAEWKKIVRMNTHLPVRDPFRPPRIRVRGHRVACVHASAYEWVGVLGKFRS